MYAPWMETLAARHLNAENSVVTVTVQFSVIGLSKIIQGRFPSVDTYMYIWKYDWFVVCAYITITILTLHLSWFMYYYT